MNLEIEKLYYDINKENLRDKLAKIGAELKKPEFLQKRVVYNFGKTEKGFEWLRLRDEGDEIKLTYKIANEDEYTKESETTVGDFDTIKKILELLYIKETSYQENKREKYTFKNSEITIDTWPFLEPVCEIESPNEKELLEIEALLSMDTEKSMTQNINSVYKLKFGKYIEELSFEDQMKITFNSENPFLKN